MPPAERPAGLRVTALAVSAQLGGTERVLLDFAARAFEFDIALSVVTPRDGPLIAILNKLGVPAHVVPASRSMLRGSQRARALATAPLALAGLYRWSRRLAEHPAVRDADVLYSVSFKTHLATLPPFTGAVGRLGGRAVVWHLHEFPPGATGRAWRELARRYPDAVIANSTPVRDAWYLPPNRPTAQPPVVIPNGVDLDRFHPRDRTFWMHDQLGIPREDRILGMPAVLARWKGQLEVIEGFAQIADEFPEAHLVLVGGSIYDTAAEDRYARELHGALARWREGGLTRVHHLPFQPKIELVYPELDLAIHYSLRPEAFGRVVLEAMACGTPVVAAAEGGPREIVTEGGWLVEPRKPAALAAALAGALRVPTETLRQLGTQGRVRAEDHFSARRFAKRVAEVLAGVSRPGASSPPAAPPVPPSSR